MSVKGIHFYSLYSLITMKNAPEKRLDAVEKASEVSSERVKELDEATGKQVADRL